jgi:hypothetical protein
MTIITSVSLIFFCLFDLTQKKPSTLPSLSCTHSLNSLSLKPLNLLNETKGFDETANMSLFSSFSHQLALLKKKPITFHTLSTRKKKKKKKTTTPTIKRFTHKEGIFTYSVECSA